MIVVNWWGVISLWFIISLIVASVYVLIRKDQDIDDVVLRAIITFILWPFYLMLWIALVIPVVLVLLLMQYFQ